MDDAPRIVGFGGTFAPVSSSLHALDAVLAAAAEEGASTTRIDAGSLDLPMYAWGATSAKADAFVEAMYAADGLVWVSPLYHGTVSGLFKNALDWLELLAKRTPAYLSNKPVGLVAVAAGTQSLGAITTMEQVARALRAYTVPLVVPIQRSSEVFDAEGRVRDERVGSQLRALGRDVTRAARALASMR
jgi:FMN reductase